MGGLRKKSLEQIYSESTDGAYARAFTRNEFRHLLASHYDAAIHTVGQKSELFPIPRSSLKDRLEHATPNKIAEAVLGRWGFMLVAEAVKRPG